MDQNKIIAAILTTSLGPKGTFDDAAGAVSTYRSILEHLAGGEDASHPSSTPIILDQDSGLADPDDVSVHNLHI